MYEFSPFTVFRALAVLYPFFTLYCIVVTANHFFLDAVMGALCYYIGLKLTPYLPKIGRGSGVDLVSGISAGSVPAVNFAQGGTGLSKDEEAEMDEEALLPLTMADLQQPGQSLSGGYNAGNSLFKKR